MKAGEKALTQNGKKEAEVPLEGKLTSLGKPIDFIGREFSNIYRCLLFAQCNYVNIVGGKRAHIRTHHIICEWINYNKILIQMLLLYKSMQQTHLVYCRLKAKCFRVADFGKHVIFRFSRGLGLHS